MPAQLQTSKWTGPVGAVPLEWRHNGSNDVSNHQPYHCLFNHLFRRRSKKTSKLRVTGLCAGNSPVTCVFLAQMASDAEMFPCDDVIMQLWLVCQKHVSRTVTSNYIPQYMQDVITCPCLWYLLLEVPKYNYYITCEIGNIELNITTSGLFINKD